jgi:hypothetical protein
VITGNRASGKNPPCVYFKDGKEQCQNNWSRDHAEWPESEDAAKDTEGDDEQRKMGPPADE